MFEVEEGQEQMRDLAGIADGAARREVLEVDSFYCGESIYSCG